MLNEKILKAINETVEGIITGGVNDDGISANVDYILNENGIYQFIEDGEENEEYEVMRKERIINDERLQVFEPGQYAWKGEIKTLNFPYICSKKFSSPFDAMEEEY